jgi:ketosteroid isomerase-like protein
MERHAEAEQTLREFAEGISSGDPSAVDHLLSGEAVRAVGTDPAEWWGPDRDAVSRLFGAQVEAMGGQFKFVLTDPEAYGAADVAWVADRPVLRAPTGDELPCRFTGVLQRENGGWKFVQLHLSMGISNEEAIGEELPT